MVFAIALAAAGIVAVPPVTLTARASPTIPPKVVQAALDEAAAVWRAFGVTIVGRIARDVESSGVGVLAERESLPVGPTVRVLFDDGPSTMSNDAGTLGWIEFAADTPLAEIHLSYANALELLCRAYGVSQVNQMPIVQWRTFVSRALGRALAHEVGHYVLGSRAHTPRGLMKARQKANDLFGPHRMVFDLSPVDRAAVVSRLIEADRFAHR